MAIIIAFILKENFDLAKDTVILFLGSMATTYTYLSKDNEVKNKEKEIKRKTEETLETVLLKSSTSSRYIKDLENQFSTNTQELDKIKTYLLKNHQKIFNELIQKGVF